LADLVPLIGRRFSILGSYAALPEILKTPDGAAALRTPGNCSMRS
jgi:hypothetical protein